MARLLEGKPVAERIKAEISQRVSAFSGSITLASIQVGRNPGSEVYIKSQQNVAESLGIIYQPHKLDAGASPAVLAELIEKLNNDPLVNGIIVQLPLPEGLDYKKINSFIHPAKDVEGIHPANIGRIVFNQATVVAPTAAAVMELLKETGVDLYGKETVIVGHSGIVGKPLSLLLLDKFATVTVCHIATSKAGKLEEHVRRAEILIVAVGEAGLIKGEWIKEGAIVLDVGINKVGDKLVGDVEFAAAEKRAAWITPVPGGVGPLTVAMLMRNVVEVAYVNSHKG